MYAIGKCRTNRKDAIGTKNSAFENLQRDSCIHADQFRTVKVDGYVESEMPEALRP